MGESLSRVDFLWFPIKSEDRHALCHAYPHFFVITLLAPADAAVDFAAVGQQDGTRAGFASDVAGVG